MTAMKPGDIVISAFVDPASDPIKGVVTRVSDHAYFVGTLRYVYVRWVGRDGRPECNESCYEQWELKTLMVGEAKETA